MNNEPSNKPEPKDSESRTRYLFLAFLPALFICMIFASAFRSSHAEMPQWILYGLNPAVSVFACIKIYDRPGVDNVAKILGGFILGIIIAFINGYVGCLAGCACAVVFK